MAIINPALDASGNGNNWTPININYFTSGVTYDTMTDVPTLTSTTTANYAVLNPLSVDTTTLSNANLTASITGSSGGSSYFSTMAIPPSSKIYAEITVTSVGDATELGITSNTSSPLNAINAGIFYYFNGDKQVLGTGSAFGASYTTNDVIGIAVDTSAGTIEFFKNNVSQGVITNSVISSNTMFFSCAYYSSNTGFTGVHSWNFGQRGFLYTPPTGFVALNTFNLPTPTIGATATTQANKYMDIALYTGNAPSSVTVTGLNFQPDLVWLKSRAYGYDHVLTDAVRGVEKGLATNATYAEFSPSGNPQLTAFNSNGFTVGNNDSVNRSSAAQLGWAWKANGSGSTNTDGSITSTVSANTTSGFSIVTYTGTGSAATIGHGLGVAPKMVIVKRRNSTGSWPVYHASLPSAAYELFLERTEAAGTPSASWNNTAPTSTVFSIGLGTAVNVNGGTYVAYCFSEVAGYSKFGSYTGNGSSDGTFVYTGFRPRFVMLKSSSNISNWIMMDTSTNPSNVMSNYLRANASDAEASTSSIDDLSNGFKLRTTDTSWNSSGGTFIYMAFAENPFKYANAR